MKEKVRFLGLDVHAETITVAVAEPDGEVRSLGTIANRAESIRKLVKKLGPVEQLRACYEAGPTGYVLYWQLASWSQVRGDRADAGSGEGRRPGEDGPAGCRAAGAQLPVRRSDGGVGSRCGFGGAARSGAGARGGQAGSVAGASSAEQVSAALGQRPAAGMKAWTQPYMAWVRQIRFTQVAHRSHAAGLSARGRPHGERVKRLEQAITEAVKLASPTVREVVKGLQALRGIAEISAVTIVAELGKYHPL
jgi:transposase